MKKKLLLLFICSCITILPYGVKAIESENNIFGDDFTNNGGPNYSNNSQYKGYYPNFKLKGVRISLVDNYGKKINGSTTIDFFCTEINGLDWTDVRYISGKKNAYDILNGSSVSYEKGKILNISGINSYFNPELCNSSLNWSGVISKIKSLSDNINSQSSTAKTFFSKFGISFNDKETLNWYYMIEPIIVIAINNNSGTRDCTALGTSMEFKKYKENLLTCSSSYPNKKWLPWSTNNYIHTDPNVTTYGSGKLSSTFHFSTPDYYGLVWLGNNYVPPPSTTTCGAQATSTTHKGELTNSSKEINTIDNMPAGYTGYYNSDTGYDKNYYVNANCYATTTTCGNIVSNSDYPSKTIDVASLHSNYYNSSYRFNPNYYVNKTCFKQPTCSDYYYTSSDYRNVILYSGASSSTNCCLAARPTGISQDQLYRDHLECYSCTYHSLTPSASCSNGSNTTTVGDSFGYSSSSSADANAQTCSYYIASGRTGNNDATSNNIGTASKNLVTRKVLNGDSYCKVICTEKISIDFPLSSKETFNSGSYITWPTSISKIGYQNKNTELNISSNTTCSIYVDTVGYYNLISSNSSTGEKRLKNCVESVYEIINSNKLAVDTYDLHGTFTATYSDSTYGNGKEFPLQKENSESSNVIQSVTVDNTSASGLINGIHTGHILTTKMYVGSIAQALESVHITLTQSAKYVLNPNTAYKYSYKNTYYLGSTNATSRWGNNYIDIGKGVLALGSKYYSEGTMGINYKNIGTDNNRNYATNGYAYGICKYKLNDSSPENCLCPNGIDVKYYVDSESLTCDEAKQKYCMESSNVCDSGTTYENKPITSTCKNDSNCYNLTCNQYTCTSSNGTCHELNTCMSTYLLKNPTSTLSQAKSYCTSQKCGMNIKDNIQYRVIDLRNPFPGISATSGSSRFNLDIKGRIPGSNWNSYSVIKNEILNNRGVTADSIYSQEPLYEFNLTPTVIKNIRSYNDGNSYDDFTLNCKGNNKTACVSSEFNFRSSTYGFVKAITACRSISNTTQFNSCYNS